MTFKCHFDVSMSLTSKYCNLSFTVFKIMELDYKIHTYAWGKKGKNSKVANLYANVNKSFKIDDKIPYAELWLGTHVNGPSSIKSLKTPLSDVFSKKPEYLGSKVRQRFGDQLPFLLKVLSVNQALSVQAHPSKVSFGIKKYFLFDLLIATCRGVT